MQQTEKLSTKNVSSAKFGAAGEKNYSLFIQSEVLSYLDEIR